MIPSAPLTELIRQRNGALTQELVQEPARFGLGKVPARLQPDNTTDSVCGFCSTGCSLTVHLREGQAINLTPATDYPVNLGMACPKGWEALSPLQAEDRATTPLLRQPNGVFVPVDWDHAMQLFCLRLRAIQDQHGPASTAFISTGQMVTEEMAFLGALAKFGMGMIHGDGNTRQCMATSVAAYKQSFGFDAPPFTYNDLEESDVIVLIGSNLCIAHPILWQRILRNPHSPEIIAIDPRRTETAIAATQHYPIAPKSDLTLLYCLARMLIKFGSVDHRFVREHTNGFDEFAAFVEMYTPEYGSQVTGLPISELLRLGRTIASGKRVSFWWTMGVNQSHEGTRTAQAIINLALMTGNIGRPGTGANSITGQCNAMGSRLYSNTTNLFGGRDFTHPAHRDEIARILQIPASRIPAENSWAYDQIIEGIRDGKIKALWIIATNTLHSWIHQSDVQKLLAQLDFLVVQDMFPTTETARAAHLILPAAGWGEKDGTFINSERRIGLTKKVSKAPGEALSDFNIFRLVAHYWGCSQMFSRWSSPEAVFQILKHLSRGRPCDITGIEDYRMLDRCGGIQWPYPQGAELKTERRLFADGAFFHPDRKARFLFEPSQPPHELTDDQFPFTLLTGRGTSAQWHTQSRTAKSAVLRKLYPRELHAEINPADAADLGFLSGETIRISSRRGSLEAKVLVTSTIQPGQVFLPMHYPVVNQLTASSFDPHSRQPSYKFAAVRLSPLGDNAKTPSPGSPQSPPPRPNLSRDKR
jgi:assimilatory nitrate reductase catalytic subunit